jgi:hypothetical protein
MQRRIAKSMEDMITDVRGRVINSSGQVIQMTYGGDGFLPSCLERDHLRLFPVDGSDWKVAYLAPYVSEDEMVYLDAMRAKVLDALSRDRDRERFNLVFTPVHLTRAMKRLTLNSEAGSGSPVSPTYVHQWRRRILDTVVSPVCGNNMKLYLYFNDHLSTKHLVDWPATEEKLNSLGDLIHRQISSAVVPAGELVGQAGAQSIGEPLTQVSKPQ